MSKLIEHLRSTGETQTSFAKRIDVHQGTISKLCANKAPSLGLALKIERATGGAVPVAAWAGSLGSDAPPATSFQDAQKYSKRGAE